MKSHTVPQRLLEQFAYSDPSTKSLRLWRYTKGRNPFWKASPEFATTVDKYFASAQDSPLEEQIEKRLAYEFENPVHAFLPKFDDPSFLMSNKQREQMTRYVLLLFNRYLARREATSRLQDQVIRELEKLLANDGRLLTFAAHLNLKALDGIPLGRLVTKEDVAKALRAAICDQQTPDAEQETFVSGIVRAMASFDEPTFWGDWRILRTTPSDPYIISDSPIVSWQRLEGGLMSFGIGLHRLDVEAFLPISPLICLQMLPAVKRTRPAITPKPLEINLAQAAFAHSDCFAHVNDAGIDRIVQQHISTLKIGKNTFLTWHIDFENVFYTALFQP